MVDCEGSGNTGFAMLARLAKFSAVVVACYCSGVCLLESHLSGHAHGNGASTIRFRTCL
jgi:hypothetical protein